MGIDTFDGSLYFSLLLHIQIIIPVVVFFAGFFAYIQAFGLLRVIILLILSIAGFVISIVLIMRGGPYGVDLDTPYPEDKQIVEHKSMIVYTLASLLAIVDSLISGIGNAIILPLIAALPNYLFFGIAYRLAKGMKQHSQEEYKRKAARRPPRLLFEEDVLTMYEMLDGQALLGVVENADDARLRGMAAEFLGKLGDSSISDDLTIGLSDEDENVQLRTAIALCHLGKDLAYFIFDEKWDEIDFTTKFEIIEALLTLNSVDARIFIEWAYKDDNPEVSSRALDALIEARGKAEKISELESKTIPPE
ncbi:MAG: HEAT repeat domain-containing protein [Candidatus Thorarchaeota archaeon]